MFGFVLVGLVLFCLTCLERDVCSSVLILSVPYISLLCFSF